MVGILDLVTLTITEHGSRLTPITFRCTAIGRCGALRGPHVRRRVPTLRSSRNDDRQGSCAVSSTRQALVARDNRVRTSSKRSDRPSGLIPGRASMGLRDRRGVANAKDQGRVDRKAVDMTSPHPHLKDNSYSRRGTSPQLCDRAPIDRGPPLSALVAVRHPFGKELDPGLRPGAATSWRRGRHDRPAYSTNSIVDGHGVRFHVIIVCEIKCLTHGENIVFCEERTNVRLKTRLYRHN